MSTKEEEDTESGGEDPEQQSLDSSDVSDVGVGDDRPKKKSALDRVPQSERRDLILLVLAFAVVIGLIVGLAVGLPNSSTAQSAQQQQEEINTKWPHEISDISPDPRVRYGTLPNGVRYMVMSNEELPDRVSIRLHVDAGSLHEDDDQQGLAHFLEHMLFEGTKNFPDLPSLDRETQRLGAHSNACKCWAAPLTGIIYAFDRLPLRI